jgi:hypothetical protein
MPAALRSLDYKPDVRATKTAGLVAGGAFRADDFASVEEFINLLARAVRQFHTYPFTSPLCSDAIAACHKVYATLERRDRLVLRVTPTELIVDEIGVGAGTVIEQELVRRLHRAHIAAIDFDRIASPRDFSRFCADIVSSEGLAKTKTSFAEQLTEHGVETIVPHMAHRPEVLNVGAPAQSLCTLVEHERRRRESVFEGGAPVNHLYPPDKGWVRLDPAAQFDTVSLVDLAVLVDDPAEIATILLRLTDDDPVGAESRGTALEQKFTDVTTLFASLDPRLARVMFGRLARAVLELEPERRTALLQRTILPGLLDGRADGNVLRDFPDVDLAESLCLLLELETAAPEVLTAALNRLDLPADRRETVVPLIDARLRSGRQSDNGRTSDAGLDRLARRLIQIEAAPGRNFTEFAAFDLSIDDQAARVLGGVREAIGATDLPLIELQCLRSLVRLEPNVSVVNAFLQKTLTRLGELEARERWHDLAAQATGYRQLADELRERRPDVADAIAAALGAFCTYARALAMATLLERDDQGREIVDELVAAFGVAAVPAFVGLLDDPARQSHNRSLASLMCAHAQLLAPALAVELAEPRHCGVAATRVAVRVLGFAGAGYEATVAEQTMHGDDPLVREALRALARIGTAQAAALVARQLRDGSVRSRAAAEEALWHFPPARAAGLVRELLGSHDFVLQNPAAVGRLIDRSAQAHIDGLDQVLSALEPLRFRFWNPGLVRVALRARELRAR